MLRFDVTLEDIHFVVTDSPEGWQISLRDTLTGRIDLLRNVTTLQLSAILALAAGYGEEEGADPVVIGALYDLASPVVDHLPQEVRPIP